MLFIIVKIVLKLIKNIIFTFISIGGIFLLIFFTYLQNEPSFSDITSTLQEAPLSTHLSITDENILIPTKGNESLSVYYTSQTDKIFSNT